MRDITPKLPVDIANHFAGQPVYRGEPFRVTTFRRLVECVAQLAYANADHLLFFRGQSRDYQSKAGGTTLYPGIYRGDNVPARELRRRFELLDQAGARLASLWSNQKLEGARDVRLKPYVRWSILQHYEVAETPLIDVTHSLRVACSFAQMRAGSDDCYVYVLGLPNVTNRITVNSEDEIVTVRLLSICPPSALRPHFQEGYLIGTSDITTDFDSKTDLDFRNRLICKFVIPGGVRFWGDGFNQIPEPSLYPRHDAVLNLCQQLKADLQAGFQAGDLGEFIREWASMEEFIMGTARKITARNVSLRDAISELVTVHLLTDQAGRELQAIRTFRNDAVHRPSTVSDRSIGDWLSRLRTLAKDINVGLLPITSLPQT